MTDKLHETLRSQAETAGFAPVDLDLVMAGGARAVRRRRAAAVGGGVVAAAAAVVLVVSLTTTPTQETDIAPADPFPVRTRDNDALVSYGNRVYVGSEEVTLEDPVERLVRTADALVYTTDADFETQVGTVRAYADGVTTDLGTGSDLAADLDGHLAAWLTTDAARTYVTVLDTRDLSTRRIDLEPGLGDTDGLPRLHDVDGDRVYVSDGRGPVSIDLVTGAVEPVDGYVVDVEDDVVVTTPFDAAIKESAPDGSRDPIPGLTADVDGKDTLLEGAISGVLSPDGTYFATSDPAPGAADGALTDVVDTSTGLRTAMDTSAVTDVPPLALEPIDWLDDDTLVVLYVPETDDPEGVLLCTAPAGTCEVLVEDSTTMPGAPKDAFPSYWGLPPFDRR